MAPKTCALLAVLALWAALASCQGAPAAGQPTATRAAVELEPEAPQAAYENEAYPAAYDDDTADAAADGAAYPEWHDGAKLVDPPPDLELAGTTYPVRTSLRTVPRATLAELAAANGPRQQQPAEPRDPASPPEELSLRTLELLRASQALNDLVRGGNMAAFPQQQQQQQQQQQEPHGAALDALVQQEELLLPDGTSEARAAHAHHPPAAAGARLSWDGISGYQDGDVNFPLDREPADPGLCEGNGFVMETAASTVRVYDAATGAALVAPLTLNAFLGLPPAATVSGSSVTFGPQTQSPSCRYDAKTRRFFHLTVSFDVDPTNFNIPAGPSYLQVSVSEGPDPTGYWRHYSIFGANNGQQGTPDFGCQYGYCAQIFPRFAVWQDAVVITSNEFTLFTQAFNGANVYALDKAALLKGAPQAATALVRTGNGRPASAATPWTLIPATQVGRCSGPNNYLMATPITSLFGWVDTLQLFSLLGTRSLRGPAPDVRLAWVRRDVKLGVKFTTPPFDGVAQRNGTNPLGIVGSPGFIPPGNNVSTVDGFDARLASLSFVDDHLYAAWGTGLPVASARLAGVAWACVDPRAPARASRDGVLGLAGNSLIFPSLAVRPGGLGVMAVVVVGPDHFPSAAYAVLSRDGLGRVTLLAPGAGPVDGFTGYNARPKPNAFGFYSTAFVDERNGAFWLSSEYVSQACSVAAYKANSTCGGTRTEFVNWATRITKVELLRGHV